MKLNVFDEIDFLPALKAFFRGLNVPINYVDDKPTSVEKILENTYKGNESFGLINDVYFLGLVDDATFRGNKSLEIDQIKSDYDGILIFGVTLGNRQNGLLPTRSQLAEISRAFNREFFYTPVVVVFRYDKYLAFANTERLKYKDNREGEKAGKVTLLRDIDIRQPHSGHERILAELAIPTTGKNKVDSFAKLYKYWEEVLSVNLLNKNFYRELSNWYFWAVGRVTFPSEPTLIDAHKKKVCLEDLQKEHKSKNVIRLLTRLLFVWFIKEKGLAPPELFELDDLQTDILKNISPNNDLVLFKQVNQDSIYYKAILQNLFFATLNCPIKPMEIHDNRVRGFRKMDSYGQHRDANFLMRYEKYFQNPDCFVEMVNSVVPFLNGGLFECLDDKLNKVYIDGFSDNLPKNEQLIVPDYLFFGVEEKVDLSSDYGITNNNKEVAVKGLINILKAYKFTITENTPIEEDVALDPELLGRVFENLLASYNPETKTTARKQTGSFYTPREIVNYMVDESLIAYLKNELLAEETGYSEEDLDRHLRQLVSFNPINPFKENTEVKKWIINALDKCTILDPACGSGAFPMGILQKMVHILFKVDPKNKEWKHRQITRVNSAIKDLENLEDAQYRDQIIKDLEAQKNDIEEAFANNELDYGRKLYLIENCIHGVDIQSIAAQISRLRFFISLVVDQKVDPSKDNFGIRPLPNLETKFVSANTLIGIAKPAQKNLFDTPEIKQLEAELNKVRHRLFSSKSPNHKRKLRDQDKALREKIAAVLQKNGWGTDTANKLANWDPYNQNISSPFFDAEWMFDISDGFDIVIGNPPYIKEYTDKSAFDGIRGGKYYQGKMDLWYAFGCVGIDHLKVNGFLCFIATNNWVTNSGASIFRDKVLNETKIEQFLDFGSYMIFENAAIQTMILLLRKGSFSSYCIDYRKIEKPMKADLYIVKDLLYKKQNHNNSIKNFNFKKDDWKKKTLNFEIDENELILQEIQTKANFNLDAKTEVAQGIVTPQDFLNRSNQQILGSSYTVGQGIFNLSNEEKECLSLSDKELELIKPFYTTDELNRFYGNPQNRLWIIYTTSDFKNELVMKSYPNLKKHLDRFLRIITSDNKPYGLHRARNEYFFKGEKIISLRKCGFPTFTYTDFDCYVSQTFFVIKSERIDRKYLTAILNSKVIAFWLRYKGKMQGDLFQVDKAPILEIPIYKATDSECKLIEIIVDYILYLSPLAKEYSTDKARLQYFEKIIDAIVFELYFSDHMKEREIDVFHFIKKDIKEVMQGKKFGNLEDREKEEVIKKLYAKWTDPDNELLDRMKLFAVRSPNVLKPILEIK